MIGSCTFVRISLIFYVDIIFICLLAVLTLNTPKKLALSASLSADSWIVSIEYHVIVVVAIGKCVSNLFFICHLFSVWPFFV